MPVYHTLSQNATPKDEHFFVNYSISLDNRHHRPFPRHARNIIKHSFSISISISISISFSPLFLVCSWFVRGLFVVCSWSVRGLFVICFCFVFVWSAFGQRLVDGLFPVCWNPDRFCRVHFSRRGSRPRLPGGVHPTLQPRLGESEPGTVVTGRGRRCYPVPGQSRRPAPTRGGKRSGYNAARSNPDSRKRPRPKTGAALLVVRPVSARSIG